MPTNAEKYACYCKHIKHSFLGIRCRRLPSIYTCICTGLEIVDLIDIEPCYILLDVRVVIEVRPIPGPLSNQMINIETL
jgi:hypothetical protein